MPLGRERRRGVRLGRQEGDRGNGGVQPPDRRRTGRGGSTLRHYPPAVSRYPTTNCRCQKRASGDEAGSMSDRYQADTVAWAEQQADALRRRTSKPIWRPSLRPYTKKLRNVSNVKMVLK